MVSKGERRMIANRKVTGRASGVPAGLAIGAGTGIIVTVVLSAVMAHLIAKEIIEMNTVGYGSILILLLASVVGGWTAVKKIKKMPMEMALANGAAYFIILVLLTAVVYGGRYQGMGVTFLCVGIGSVIAGISAGKCRRKAKRKATKKWHG